MPRGSRGKSSAGKRRGHIAAGRKDVYNKLKKRYGKHVAAAIANAGATFAGRSVMARKAAKTRAARGRKR